LDEDIVSREHARIEIHLNHIHIYDLESMNGIFVNNQRVGEAELAIGDKIRIGSKIFILDPNLASSSQTRVKNAISGSLQNTDIGTLLGFIENIKTLGTLNIGTEEHRSSIHFLEGKIRCAEFLDGQKERTSLEVMNKILSWTSGNFKLRPSSETTCEGDLNLRVSDLLLSHLAALSIFQG